MDHVQKHAVLAPKPVQDLNMDRGVVAVNAQDCQPPQYHATNNAVQVRVKVNIQKFQG